MSQGINDIAGQKFTLEGENEIWRVCVKGRAFKYHQAGDEYSVFYYDTGLFDKDPGSHHQGDMQNSTWDFLEGAMEIVGKGSIE